jgi:esterase
LKSEERNGQTPLIAIHGLLDSKASFSKVLGNEEILKRRDCYLVGIRNHSNSDWHDDTDYIANSDDIIRFADKMGIDKFTLLGHSMGGRISMHTACRFPDRVEGIISLDSTPFHWNKLCYVFTVPPWRYLARM